MATMTVQASVPSVRLLCDNKCMGSKKVDPLEARVEKLERCNKYLLVLVIMGVCVFGLMGMKQDDDGIVDVLKARALLIYSPDNEVLVQARYDTWTNGGAIAIYDKNGERRSWWRASLGGAHLYLAGERDSDASDEDPYRGHSLSLSARSSASALTIIGKGGMAIFGTNADKTPSIRIWSDDDDRKPVFTTIDRDQ